jgi:hypothetical protein
LKSFSNSKETHFVIGNKSSVTIGPGVFVGQGKGVVPLDDPNKARCVTSMRRRIAFERRLPVSVAVQKSTSFVPRVRHADF